MKSYPLLRESQGIISMVHPRRYLSAIVPEQRSPAIEVQSSLQRIAPYTMVKTESLIDLAAQTSAILIHEIPGNFVECGAWRGGASFLMADILRKRGARDRKVWMFDSFEGIQPPQAIDGPAAQAWQNDKKWFQDNLRVDVESVRRTAQTLGLESFTRIVKGWFDATLPAHREKIGPIALLRIDCDWHASITHALEALYGQVVEGGFVIFDDYYSYDGAARAVHEFLGTRGLSHRLEPIEAGPPEARYHSGMIFRKCGQTWSWMKQTLPILEQIAQAVPSRQTFILVDEDQLATGGRIAGRRALPFMEKDGVYWGAPADDAAAIAELDRLKQLGASFLIFTKPAFWWMEHYRDFMRHVRAAYSLVKKSEQIVGFDLRAIR
jgi:hypothetical protein